MQIAMTEDTIIPIAELDPVSTARGTYFGDGVYEVIRSYDGEIFALDEHLDRFVRSLKGINITTVDINKIRQKVLGAHEKAAIANAKIYFHITRGLQQRKHTAGKNLKPNFFLTVTELEDGKEEKTNGIAVASYADLRWKRCDIKSLNLLPNVLARMAAERKGCKEAILVDENGRITEGAGSAFFAIVAKKKKLLTRPLGLVEKAITPQQAQQADELFIAVTTRDIVPVVKFDGKKIANGKVGENTQNLMAEFIKVYS